MQVPDSPIELADLSESTGEELMRRGEEMLEMGRRLIIQAGELRGVDAGKESQLVETEEERSVGRFGVVRLDDVIRAAQELGRFTRQELQEKLGLKPIQITRWLALLLDNKPRPIITRTGYGSGTHYEYAGPADVSDPRERPESARAVDAMAGVGADRHADGRPVPYVGRPIGPSGKPGQDKRTSNIRRVRGKGGVR